MRRKKKNIMNLYIKYSCLTGRAVWVNFSPTRKARWAAYQKACRHEIERKEHWEETQAQRREFFLKMLSDYQSNISCTAELTPKQKEAVRVLLRMANEKIPFQSEFYDDMMEERRRKAEDKEIRRQMRERAAAERAGKNPDYDKHATTTQQYG